MTVTERTVTIRAPGRETEHREISAAEAVQLTRQAGVMLDDRDARDLEEKLENLSAHTALDEVKPVGQVPQGSTAIQPRGDVQRAPRRWFPRSL